MRFCITLGDKSEIDIKVKCQGQMSSNVITSRGHDNTYSYQVAPVSDQ